MSQTVNALWWRKELENLNVILIDSLGKQVGDVKNLKKDGLKLSWQFSGPESADGYQLLSGKTVVWSERFRGGPFNIPQQGGTIELNCGPLTINNTVTIEDLWANTDGKKLPEVKPPFRSIDEEWMA